MKEAKKSKNQDDLVKKDEPVRKKPAKQSDPDRRNFVTATIAVVVGGLVALFPPLAGLAMFADPLWRKSKAADFLKVATLDQVDDQPRAFSVMASRTDAWNVYPEEPVGACYLRIAEDEQGQKLEALSAICPHLGCFVDFNGSKGIFQCPCHDSSFEANGARINPETCPAARDLDGLEVELRNDNEVWVKYQKFIGGSKEKIPEA
jgi:menaquinol-cytochrome c reductase iron-sulfur subunit